MNKEARTLTISEALKEYQDAYKDKDASYQRQLEMSRNAALRRQAKARGETTYHGTPCSKPGHGTLRKTYHGCCVDCQREQNREYRDRQRKEREVLRAAVKAHGITVDINADEEV